jgi:hypothetical protein
MPNVCPDAMATLGVLRADLHEEVELLARHAFELGRRGDNHRSTRDFAKRWRRVSEDPSSSEAYMSDDNSKVGEPDGSRF